MADATYDANIDWSNQVDDGNPITDSQWDTGTLAIVAESFTPASAVVRVSGLAPGITYELTNTVTLADGATFSQTIQIAMPGLGYTTLDRVVAEVPGFKLGGRIAEPQVTNWVNSIAQSINGALLRRGLPLDPTQWTSPAAQDALEIINRLGAAARLAHAVGGQFGAGEWGLAKNLQADYVRELSRLESGDYDKLFLPSAATIEAGPQVHAGDQSDPQTGSDTTSFTKEQIF